MYLGIVTQDGKKIRQHEILSTLEIPLPPFIGFREALIEDPHHAELIKEKKPSVTVLIDMITRCKLNVWFKYNLPIYVPLRNMLSMIHGTWLQKYCIQRLRV